jgi:hypothetical protein
MLLLHRKRAKGEWVAKRMARQDVIEVPLIEVPGEQPLPLSMRACVRGVGREILPLGPP